MMLLYSSINYLLIFSLSSLIVLSFNSGYVFINSFNLLTVSVYLLINGIFLDFDDFHTYFFSLNDTFFNSI